MEYEEDPDYEQIKTWILKDLEVIAKQENIDTDEILFDWEKIFEGRTKNKVLTNAPQFSRNDKKVCTIAVVNTAN